MPKVIVITGAGVGLGRAIARLFASQGETVVLLGRTGAKVEAVAKDLGGAAMALECDVADVEQVKATFAKIAERHPKIDVLINNAAFYQPFELVDATDEQITRIINSNYTGAVFCARSAIPMMGQGGQIINVSSESIQVQFPLFSMYQSSKAGLEEFSHRLYLELIPRGIRVTCVRAGQMMDAEKGWDVDPEASMKFYQACLAAGLDLAKRPISDVRSVAPLFRTLIDLPKDLHVDFISLHAWAGN